MCKVALYIVVSVFLLTGFAGISRSQQAADLPLAPVPATTAAPVSAELSFGQSLYDGEPLDTSGIQTASWGGGLITEDSTVTLFPGAHSLKVESPGFYQGGQIIFKSPFSLGDITDPSKYIVLSVKLATDPKYVTPTSSNTNTTTQTNTPYGAESPRYQNENFTGSPSHLLRLAQNQVGPPQGWQPPTGFGPPGQAGPPADWRPPGQNNAQNSPSTGTTPYTEPAPPALPAQSIHLILTMSDGTQTDAIRPLPVAEYDRDWIDIGLPLSKLKLANAGQAPKLSAITVCTDSPTFTNIGQIKLESDTTPITCDAGGEKDVSVNEEAVFNGKAAAGVSTLKYQWDFDSTGTFTVQAEGSYATHTYSKSGVYTVTLVVSDVDGIKSPATSTATVHVEQ